jgi:valyl-tRNA synthetase
VTALPNRWVLSRLYAALDTAASGIDAYRLDEANSALYHFLWDEFCDWYLELSKPALDSGNAALVAETEQTLVHVLDVVLRALHPMMPHITEEIWQRVPKHDAAAESIMIAPYPFALRDARASLDAERDFETVRAFVSSIRTIRAEHDLPKSKVIDVHWHSGDEAKVKVLEQERTSIETLARCTLHAETDAARLDAADTHFENAAIFSNFGVRAAVPGVIDADKERDRLSRELAKVEKELGAVEKKLANPHFVERAPKKVVDKSKTHAAQLRERRENLRSALSGL